MAAPMAQSIFAAPSSRNKPLVEFKAGKMLIRGKMVIPDKRKGKIEIAHGSDQLTHFKWKDRSSGQVETDLIIFPDEAVFKRVKQCTTGRVYLLEWKNTERRLFFWMQEPSDEKDAELCEKVNKALNAPPAADNAEGGGAGGIGGMTQEQLLAMMSGLGGLGGMGGAGARRRGAQGSGATRTPAAAAPAAPTTPAPTTSTATRPEPAVPQQQLQNILRQLADVQGSATSAAPAGQNVEEDIDLSSVMSSEALLPLLSNPQVAEQLMPYLPEGQRNPEELRELVRSPQFHQALQAFNSALQSGALAEVLPALGLPPSAGGGGVQQFLRALQEQSQSQRGEGEQESQSNQRGSQERKDDEGEGGGDKKDGDGMDTS